MLTKLQRQVLASVLRETDNGRWYRAGSDGRGSSGGQRVTLASLHARGLVKRRCHRGIEGESNAAHEYQVSDAFKAEWDRKCAEARANGPR